MPPEDGKSEPTNEAVERTFAEWQAGMSSSESEAEPFSGTA